MKINVDNFGITTYRLAPAGRQALAGYLKAMRQLLAALETGEPGGEN